MFTASGHICGLYKSWGWFCDIPTELNYEPSLDTYKLHVSVGMKSLGGRKYYLQQHLLWYWKNRTFLVIANSMQVILNTWYMLFLFMLNCAHVVNPIG